MTRDRGVSSDVEVGKRRGFDAATPAVRDKRLAYADGGVVGQRVSPKLVPREKNVELCRRRKPGGDFGEDDGIDNCRVGVDRRGDLLQRPVVIGRAGVRRVDQNVAVDQNAGVQTSLRVMADNSSAVSPLVFVFRIRSAATSPLFL